MKEAPFKGRGDMKSFLFSSWINSLSDTPLYSTQANENHDFLYSGLFGFGRHDSVSSFLHCRQSIFLKTHPWKQCIKSSHMDHIS